MEEGSLLATALQRRGSHQDPHNSKSKNSLRVALFAWQQENATTSTDEERLLATAAIHPQLLQSLLDDYYPWWMGHAPVWQLTTTATCDSSSSFLPYWTCVLDYGVQMADCWHLIDRIRLLTQRLKDNTRLAWSCWDVSDQIDPIVTVGADHLPCWLHHQADEITAARNRCWYLASTNNNDNNNKSQGHFVWLPPLSTDEKDAHECCLTLACALKRLQQYDNVQPAADGLGAAVQARLCRQRTTHRTAVAVPRVLAQALHKLTTTTTSGSFNNTMTLANRLVAAFLAGCNPDEENMQVDGNDNDTNSAARIDFDEWVWTTVNLGRTHYAVLRTAIDPNETTATIRSTVSLSQRKREARNETLPHLQHGVTLGMRLTVGLQRLFRQLKRDEIQSGKQGLSTKPAQPRQRILEFWPAQMQQDSLWLQQAWQDGPQRSTFDLSTLMKIPVSPFEEKAHVWSISALRSLLKQHQQKSMDSNQWQSLPRSNQVDLDESWMEFPSSDALDPLVQSATTNGLDGMLETVQDFVKGTSGPEGVEGLSSVGQSGVGRPIDIDPDVFLRLWHATLTVETPQDLDDLLASLATKKQLEEDRAFFAPEDYDDVLRVENDDGNGDDNVGGDHSMQAVMEAMDGELLRATKLSRKLDLVDGSESVDMEGSHVLSNFLKSMESAQGKPGPTSNLLSMQLEKAKRLDRK